jgi:hypothetical protein
MIGLSTCLTITLLNHAFPTLIPSLIELLSKADLELFNEGRRAIVENLQGAINPGE